jgi:hypothetical protein
MSALKNLTSDESISNEKDSVGGGGTLASGLYPAKITLAYVTTSSGGATGLVLHAKTSEGRDIRSTQWMTSGTAKGAKNFYEKDGVKNYLPGFLLAQSLALLTCGKELSDMDTEQKVANVYSFDVKAEVPTKVDMVMDLLGKEVVIGLIRQTVDKNVKDGNGVYVPSGETRDENEIDKFFRASDRKTTAEIRAKAEEAVFVNTWDAKWNGQVRDRSTKGAGTAGAPRAAAAVANKKPTASLFA